jgi:nitrile hydratase
MQSRKGPRFRLGDKVRVLDLHFENHYRTPGYIRGHQGEVVHFCGVFLNPERLAIGDTAGPAIPLYRVRFWAADLWGMPPAAPDDAVFLELYEHWLGVASSKRTLDRASEQETESGVSHATSKENS